MIELNKSKSAKDKEARLQQKLAKIQADLARAQKAAKDAERRDETRRKIVLGGALLRGIEKGKIPPAVGRGVLTFVVERDRKLFENFEFKVTESATTPDAQRE
jgi:hypothetical protein